MKSYHKFIPGIYNYCDRWCEKCTKTKRCRLYLKDQDDRKAMINKGLNPDDFDVSIQMMANNLKETIDLISRHAQKKGIDLHMSKKDEKYYEDLERKIDHSKDPIYKEAFLLYKMSVEWIKSVPPLDLDHYKNAYEIFAWHHSIVPIKLARSISSKLESKYSNNKDERQSDLEDSLYCAYTAYRSARKCRDALDHMDNYVGDFRIQIMVDRYDKLIKQIENILL